MTNALFNAQVTQNSRNGNKPGRDESAVKEVVPGELLTLDRAQRRRLEKLCREAIEHWDESTSGHMEDLRRWNDLSEGVVEVTDWPWAGASHAHIPLIETHMKSIHSVICRSMTTVSPLWFGRTFEEDVRELVPVIEDFLDCKAKSDLNTVEAVNGVVWSAARDSIGHTKTYYAEEYERVCSLIVAETPEDFTNQFPTPESVGMAEDEYLGVIEQIKRDASEDNPVEIPIKYDKLVYEGPKTDVIDEADWVQAPATVVELRDCWAYGHVYYASQMTIKRRIKDGEMWEKQAQRLLDTGAPGEPDAWKQSKNRIEGVSDKTSKRSGQHKLYELVIRLDLDQDGEEERYVCQYSKDKGILLAATDYYFDCEVYQQWRLLKKPNRRLGVSIPGELEGTNQEVDDSVRQDINSSKIDSVPMFIGKKAVKKDLDEAGFNDNFFFPGATLYTENGKDDITSFNVKGSDKGFSQAMRQEFVRYSEMLIGPTQMLSGRESPIDPEAPGNKTIALIQQSNMRIEDYINGLRPSFDALGEIILKLYHQFGKNKLKYNGREGQFGQELKRAFLGSDVKLATHGVRAMENPEVEAKKALDVMAVMSKYEEVMRDPMKKRELFNRYLISARVEGREDLIPTKEEVEGEHLKQMEGMVREKIMGELIAKGIIPPPMPPPGIPGGPGAGPLPGMGGPMPAAAPGLPGGVPMPGAPPGAVGLPALPNLPPVVGV